jgi:hypothetical protein
MSVASTSRCNACLMRLEPGTPRVRDVVRGRTIFSDAEPGLRSARMSCKSAGCGSWRPCPDTRGCRPFRADLGRGEAATSHWVAWSDRSASSPATAKLHRSCPARRLSDRVPGLDCSASHRRARRVERASGRISRRRGPKTALHAVAPPGLVRRFRHGSEDGSAAHASDLCRGAHQR